MTEDAEIAKPLGLASHEGLGHAVPERDVLPDLMAAAARKWTGDPACQQAGLFARSAAEVSRLRVTLHHVEAGLAAAEEDRDRAVRLLHMAMAQLRQWQNAYGAHTPPWLPPGGDVRLAEDVAEFAAGLAGPNVRGNAGTTARTKGSEP